MSRVIAFVLTYNRKDLLQQCLKAIMSQTRACDEVIVVDNASTDGTSVMLQETWLDRVHVYTLSRNIGASGGFSAGFRLAYARGADFVWVMDDDVIPAEDALERLLAADRTLNAHGIKHAFVGSLPRTPEGELTNIPDVYDKRNKVSYPRWPDMLDHKMVAVRRATFVSILIPREVIRRHGLPMACMYIWGEDIEYTRRITRDVPGYLVGDSRVVHVRAVSGPPRIATEVDPTRLRWHTYAVRNAMYTLRAHKGRGALARAVRTRLVQALHFALRGDLKRAKIITRGLLLGLSFRPVAEPAEAPLSTLNVTATVIGPPDPDFSTSGEARDYEFG